MLGGDLSSIVRPNTRPRLAVVQSLAGLESNSLWNCGAGQFESSFGQGLEGSITRTT
jgi:hypothetical protein